MNKYINNINNKVYLVKELQCYTVDEQDDVTITDPEIIADFCRAQMGDEYDFEGFTQRLYDAGYEFEDATVEETA